MFHFWPLISLNPSHWTLKCCFLMQECFYSASAGSGLACVCVCCHLVVTQSPAETLVVLSPTWIPVVPQTDDDLFTAAPPSSVCSLHHLLILYHPQLISELLLLSFFLFLPEYISSMSWLFLSSPSLIPPSLHRSPLMTFFFFSPVSLIALTSSEAQGRRVLNLDVQAGVEMYSRK